MIIIDMVKVGTQGEEKDLFQEAAILWGVNHVNNKLAQGWLVMDGEIWDRCLYIKADLNY